MASQECCSTMLIRRNAVLFIHSLEKKRSISAYNSDIRVLQSGHKESADYL
jgi:hypothetical protein